MGQFCGAAVHLFAYIYAVYRLYNWTEIAEETHKRIENDNKIKKEIQEHELHNM
jgi:hypothetical protein